MAKLNVESAVIGWLPDKIEDKADWPISGDKPETLPDNYILVDRTNGPRESMALDQAEILIEVYSKNSRNDASEKANEIADIIPNIKIDVENITRAKVNSVVHLDDTVTKYHRYQVYCDIFARR